MRILITVVFTLLFITSQAQKWGLRGSFHISRCYSEVNVLAFNSNVGGRTTISNKFDFTERNFFRGFFGDISIVRNFDKKNSLIFGYRLMQPFYQSSIEYVTSNGALEIEYGERETVRVPAFKLNYERLVIGSKHEVNPSKVNVFGGLTLCFAGEQAFFDTIAGGVQAGSFYIINKRIEWYRPSSPLPYFNFGINADLRLGRKFKIGIEAASYIGTKTLFIVRYAGKTNDASYVYETKIKPYFFTGGFYLHYNIL